MNGYRTRNYPINLTPWYRNAAGDVAGITLPAGYRLYGSAIRATGPYRLELYRGYERIAVYDIALANDCRNWLLIAANLAYIDQEERAVTVTTDPDGWITSITEGTNG